MIRYFSYQFQIFCYKNKMKERIDYIKLTGSLMPKKYFYRSPGEKVFLRKHFRNKTYLVGRLLNLMLKLVQVHFLEVEDLVVLLVALRL